MSAYQRLDMRQGQSLVMTPQLQQAIKLLQLSNIELAEFVAEEIERNPLLERKDNAGSEDFDGDVDKSKGRDELALDGAEGMANARDAVDAHMQNCTDRPKSGRRMFSMCVICPATASVIAGIRPATPRAAESQTNPFTLAPAPEKRLQ